jgi:hypothetical protein
MGFIIHARGWRIELVIKSCNGQYQLYFADGALEAARGPMRLSRLNHGLPNSPLRCDMVSSTAALSVGIVPFLTPRALSLRRDGLLSMPYGFESEIVWWLFSEPSETSMEKALFGPTLSAYSSITWEAGLPLNFTSTNRIVPSVSVHRYGLPS